MTKLSKYFSLKEALYLPKLNLIYEPTEQEKENIIKTAEVLDKVREILNTPINIHVWIRPVAVKTESGIINYNELVKGAKNSAHITGEAVDFSTKKHTIDEILDIIQPKCQELQIALENNGSQERIKLNGGSGGPRNWVHLQIRPLTIEPKYRIFNP